MSLHTVETSYTHKKARFPCFLRRASVFLRDSLSRLRSELKSPRLTKYYIPAHINSLSACVLPLGHYATRYFLSTRRPCLPRVVSIAPLARQHSGTFPFLLTNTPLHPHQLSPCPNAAASSCITRTWLTSCWTAINWAGPNP